jgi:hypothetical protein
MEDNAASSIPPMNSVVILFVFVACAPAAADGGALAEELAEERSQPPHIKLPGQGAKP